MSKFFTYDERLEVQKHLKESLSFKEISRRINKHPTTISREIRKYSLEAATGYPGYCFNECKSVLIVETKIYVPVIAGRKDLPIVSYVLRVMITVLILYWKYVLQGIERLMYVMVVKH